MRGEQAAKLEVCLGKIGSRRDGLPQLGKRRGRVTGRREREAGFDMQTRPVATRDGFLLLECRSGCRLSGPGEDEDEDQRIVQPTSHDEPEWSSVRSGSRCAPTRNWV